MICFAVRKEMLTLLDDFIKAVKLHFCMIWLRQHMVARSVETDRTSCVRNLFTCTQMKVHVGCKIALLPAMRT